MPSAGEFLYESSVGLVFAVIQPSAGGVLLAGAVVLERRRRRQQAAVLTPA